MKSFTSRSFRSMYARLPEPVRRGTRKAYKLFQQNPSHPGLQFKKIDEEIGLYSVRVGISYRALGMRTDDTIVWFWIGTHAEYDKLV